LLELNNALAGLGGTSLLARLAEIVLGAGVSGYLARPKGLAGGAGCWRPSDSGLLHGL